MPDFEIDLPPDLAAKFEDHRKAVIAAAEAAIESGEHEAVQLFAEHHFEEVDDWRGTAPTSAADIVKMLRLQSIWGGEEADAVTLDFGIGEDISNNVVAMRFNRDWELESVEMES